MNSAPLRPFWISISYPISFDWQGYQAERDIAMTYTPFARSLRGLSGRLKIGLIRGQISPLPTLRAGRSAIPNV